MKNLAIRTILLSLALSSCIGLSAQSYKEVRLAKAVEKLGLDVPADSLLPDKTLLLTAGDGRKISLRTDAMGEVEHVGIPLFSDLMRYLQPSPVYDFMEFAVVNWKYKVNPNLLYLSKVRFKLGSWEALFNEDLLACDCSIENRDDQMYIVTWQREGKEVAVLGIPIDYELLNNDTRRNMERAFVRDLTGYNPLIVRPEPAYVSEDKLSIYGTEGLFVIPGKSYIIDLLNQNVYYKLTTVTERADTVIGNKPVTMSVEAVLPVVVRDSEHPAETFANLMMCDDASVPDVTVELDFHLSDYHRQQATIPLSKLKAFCRQNGCNMYFACDGVREDNVRGVMFASNLPKGYNHLFSLRMDTEQLVHAVPTVHADVYLYIPPVSREKLFGITPVKKSGKIKLP